MERIWEVERIGSFAKFFAHANRGAVQRDATGNNKEDKEKLKGNEKEPTGKHQGNGRETKSTRVAKQQLANQNDNLISTRGNAHH